MSLFLAFLGVAVIVIVTPRAGDVLRRPAIRRTVEGITGTVLIGLGLRIAAEQR